MLEQDGFLIQPFTLLILWRVWLYISEPAKSLVFDSLSPRKTNTINILSDLRIFRLTLERDSVTKFSTSGFLSHQTASFGPVRGFLEGFSFLADFHGVIQLLNPLPGV